MAKAKLNQIIAMSAPVDIVAAEAGEDGKPKGPPKFDVLAYTGGALRVGGYDQPVVVDLKGVEFGKSLVANLDHVSSQRVGNVTAQQNTGEELRLSGTASAVTASQREVVESADNGFVWQASIEAMPTQIVEVAAGEVIEANGKSFTGPLYLAKKSTLKGFAFVSHGADDNTTVSIAATRDNPPEKKMKPEVKAWAQSLGVDVENASDEQVKTLEANYAGLNHKPEPKPTDFGKGIEARKENQKRIDAISEIALNACDSRPYDIEAIQDLGNQAIDNNWSVDKFRLELLEAAIPQSQSVFSPRRRDERLSNKVLEAAVCMAGRLPDVEKHYDDQTLQAAHDKFRSSGISLNQLMLLGAQANGYNTNHSTTITAEVQNAAFGMASARPVNASGFSTVSIPNILSNVANKFLRQGWDMVDMTPLRIAAIKSVNDFKTHTTVSLTGDMVFNKVGPTGEIQHGSLGEETYTNKADTYARMLAVTRTDYINDNLGALTEVPKKLGRGAGLKLNNIFWTEFLDNSAFFASGNSNVSTADGTLGSTGLEQAETIFMNQTDPDGNPLLVSPAILVVPTALKTTALQLMNSEKVKGDTDGPDANVWRDRFRVESSPYMSNTAYTGYSSVAWYLIADPNEMPVIEIAALYGRVEPVVETADAAFNVLGVQMRGYSDVGVAKQEYRGGVRADGSGA